MKAAFVVGLTNLLHNYCGKKINKRQLAEQSIHFEQKILREVVGSQDQIAAAYGGFNKINFKIGGGFNVRPFSLRKNTIKKLNNNLLLVYSGFKRTAHHIASGYIKKLQSSKKQNIIRILNLVKEGEQALIKGKLDDFAKLLHESWLEKKDLSKSISNPIINEIYNNAIIF